MSKKKCFGREKTTKQRILENKNAKKQEQDEGRENGDDGKKDGVDEDEDGKQSGGKGG